LQQARTGVEYFAARDQYNAVRANIALSRVNEEVQRFGTAAVELSGGLLSLGASGFGKFNCFAAGTPVATPRGEVPIEKLKLGDRVDAGNAQCASEHLAKDALTIGLDVPDPRGSDRDFHVELARTQAWLDERALGDGLVQLELDEIGGFSQARVTHVLPAPQEQAGEGCLVLMTIEHRASELLDLHLSSHTDIKVTPLHPIFVEGRGWVSAQDLTPGLMLRSDRGPIRLDSVNPAPADRSVFNLEVGLEHAYRVTSDRVWVHNNSPIFQNFASEELAKHFGEHAADFGPRITPQQYLQKARNLLNSEPGGKILGKVRVDGDIIRFNKATGEFAVGAPDGTIRTFFKPTDGIRYYNRQ
jgi:hypothetical protein